MSTATKVKIMLAHPLDDYMVERLGLPKLTGHDRYGPGVEVVMQAEQARGVVAAGYAAVDVEDKQAVLKALRPDSKLNDVEVGLAPVETDEPDVPVQASGENLRADAPSVDPGASDVTTTVAKSAAAKAPAGK